MQINPIFDQEYCTYLMERDHQLEIIEKCEETKLDLLVELYDSNLISLEHVKNTQNIPKDKFIKYITEHQSKQKG